jgi:hypothetical protein
MWNLSELFPGNDTIHKQNIRIFTSSKYGPLSSSRRQGGEEV